MASFLVETYVRQVDREGFATAVDDLRAAIETLGAGTTGVRHLRSYLVPSDEMGIHAVDADSVDVVKRLAQLAGIEVERIVVAIKVPGGALAGGRMAGARTSPNAGSVRIDPGTGSSR